MNLNRSSRTFKVLFFFAATIALNMILAEECSNQWEFVAVGRSHSLGLMRDGTVLGWGENQFNQAGYNNSRPYGATPTILLEGAKWRQITTNMFSSFGILSNGTLWGWGRNNKAQLGDGSQENRTTLIQIGNDADWEMVASGASHTLALKKDGSLWVWGTGRFGQLGIEIDPEKNQDSSLFSFLRSENEIYIFLKPTKLESDIKWKKVFAGNSQSFAISEDGTLWAWGQNDHGKLGDNTEGNQKVPVKIAPQIKWKEIAVGEQHTLGLDVNGHLYAWGVNDRGQLGEGIIGDKHVPTRVGNKNWKSISARDHRSLGVQEDGTLWEWGIKGQRRGKFSKSVQVGQEFLWKFVAAAEEHTFAITKEGYMMAWGSNRYGELGNGERWGDAIRYPMFCSGSRGVCFEGECLAECPEGFIELSGLCYQQRCEEGQYYDEKTSSCLKMCQSGCKTCKGFSNYCTSCQDGFLLNPRHLCEEKCSTQCKTCQGTKDSCTSCHPGQYFAESTNKCVKDCYSNCKTCHQVPTRCTSCHLGLTLNHNTKSCVQCNPICRTCANITHPNICTSCESPLKLDEEYHNCVEYCDSNCLTCSGTTKNCTSCNAGSVLHRTKFDLWECKVKCDKGCICEGAPNFCRKCEKGYDFNDDDHTCLPQGHSSHKVDDL